MKETFDIPNSDLVRLSITLKERKPYMVFAIVSTGVNNDEFQGNQPTRVYIQEYVFNEERQEYCRGMTFDKMVKCSPEALDFALKNQSNYDAFANGGINKDDYINGINVMEVSDFKTAFSAFVDGAAEGTLYIANGVSFCETMLSNIDCAEKFSELVRNQKVLDQRALTVAYFKQHTISPKKTTLEALNDVIRNYDEGHTEKIVGVDKRVKVIADFVNKYGVEQGLLLSDIENNDRYTSTLLQDMQASGRKKYLNADLDAKFDILINNPKQALSAEVTNREHDCDLNRLYDIIEGKNENVKGIVFFQVGTTGFKADNMPIQFSAVLCELREGRLVATKQQYFDIRTEQRAIQKALDFKNKGEFDAFAYTGIDIDAYFEGYQTDPAGVKSSKPQKEIEAAANTINRFFEKYPPSEYPLVTNGRGRDGQSFSQTALASMANVSIINAPYIDFAQIIKEYSYVAHYDSKYPCNVLLDEAKGVKNFSLAEVGQHQAELKGKPVEEVFIENCHSLKKCRFVIDMINQICKQHNEMLYSTPEQTAEQPMPETDELDSTSAPEQDNVAVPIPNEHSEENVDFLLDNINSILGTGASDVEMTEDSAFSGTVEEASFIGEGYSNIVDSISSVDKSINTEEAEMLKAEREAEAEILRENVEGEYQERDIFASAPDTEKVGETTIRRVTELSVEPEMTEQATDKPSVEAPTSVSPTTSASESIERHTETPSKPAPSISQVGVSPDIAALVSAMTAQTEAYQAQMSVMNAQMSALIEQNNALINYMATQNKALVLTLNSTIEVLAERSMEQGSEHSTGRSPIERLEEVKDTIANMFAEVPAPSKAYLQSANSMISKGQTEIDKTEQREKPTKAE